MDEKMSDVVDVDDEESIDDLIGQEIVDNGVVDNMKSNDVGNQPTKKKSKLKLKSKNPVMISSETDISVIYNAPSSKPLASLKKTKYNGIDHPCDINTNMCEFNKNVLSQYNRGKRTSILRLIVDRYQMM